jgi:hypothetical protein
MSNHDHLPEAYMAEGDRGEKHPVTAPTYELLADCHLVMHSAETGRVGPTMVLAGEVLTTELTPNHHWLPLNQAAGKRIEEWLASLPATGGDLQLGDMIEAAQMLRPREGEPQMTNDQWAAALLKLASDLKVKRTKGLPVAPPVSTFRPGKGALPIMPNANIGSVVPHHPGAMSAQMHNDVALHQPQHEPGRTARTARTARQPAMAGTNPPNPVQQPEA